MVEAYFAALLAARRYSSLYGAVSSSWVFSLGFVMAGRSFLLVGMEKGQSIFSAALWVLNKVILLRLNQAFPHRHRYIGRQGLN